MTQETCLLIKLKDKRCFFTDVNNIDILTEFLKTFKAELYLVETRDTPKILNMKSLAKAICDQKKNYETKHRKLEKLFPKPKRSRRCILKDAEKIQKFIARRFISGKPLSLKELKDKYKSCNLTDACLCQHMTKVRKALIKEGRAFQKLVAGKYQLAN